MSNSSNGKADDAANPMQPVEHSFQSTGARLTYFEWGQVGDPQVLLIHATGFHARCWDAVVAAMPTGPGKGYHIYAVDMRGHGRSERLAPYVWESFGHDVGELVEHLELSDAIGVGHSMGAHCLTQVCAQYPGAFKRLLLIDPVIFDPEMYTGERYPGLESAADHPVSKRRDSWTGWEEMYERFKDRGSFGLWKDEVLRDYCRYGVLPKPDGNGFELACPPLVESSIYLGNRGTNVYELIPLVQIPVVILRAKGRDPGEHELMDFTVSPTWEKLAEQFAQGRDVYLPHLTHFIPMQDPELVARFIVDEDAQA